MATAVLCRLGAAREYQKMAANRKPKVGAARRAAPRLRRECAVLSANPPAEPPGRRVGCYGNTQNFGKLSGLRSYGLPENMIICGTPLSAVLCRLGAGPRMAQILANRKKWVGADRRAAPNFRRERAVSPNQILPQSRRDAEEGVIESPRISAARTTPTISSAPHSGSRSKTSSPGKH